MIQENIENIVALIGIALIFAGCLLKYGADAALIVSGALLLLIALIPAVLNAIKPES